MVAGTDVPASSALEFTVTMLAVESAATPRSELDSATERKELGNLWFKAGRYDRAARCYKTGADTVPQVRTHENPSRTINRLSGMDLKVA